MAKHAFWQVKTLEQMSDKEWESLCDGCGRCCMNKLEDEDSGHVYFTRVSCELLDTSTCRCTDYKNRSERVTDCLSVRPITSQKLGWLPASCAYRRLSEGKPLEDWHPLISGNAATVAQAGISMAGQCITETFVSVDDLITHLVEWNAE